ncbi:protein kinase domain-containing protein [Actinoallomurus vinaceus]
MEPVEPIEEEPTSSPTVPASGAGSAFGSQPTAHLLLDRYELLRVLGAGGMASVHLAYDHTARRQVAVKFMLPDLAHKVEFRRRFEREAKVATGLDHPRIVTVFESGRASLDGDNVPYLVMEYIEGETLARHADRLRAKGERMSVPEALELTAQVLDALACAHEQGVIHRDIKPGNVMITSNGSIKVMDFGIARLAVPDVTKLTQSGAVLGTPHYMSPEQFEGREAGPASDLYSVGTMLFELLAGEPPFSGDSFVAILRAVIGRPPPALDRLRPDVGVGVARLVRQALSKSPRDRASSAKVMASRLRDLAEEHRRGTVVLTPDDLWEPDPPAKRGHARLRRRPARPGAARRLLVRLAILAATVAAAALVVSAEGWPLGVRPVATRAHPVGWHPWRLEVDRTDSMVPGLGGQSSKLFMTTSTGVLAIDREKGRKLWEFGAPTMTSSGSGRDLAVSTDAMVYFASDSTVYALSASDGTPRWHRQLFFEGSSAGIEVATAGGDLFVETPDAVLRLDPATGAIRWQWQPNHCGMVISEVFVATPDVLLAACRSPTNITTLEALDTQRGRERWHRTVSGVFMPRILQAGSRVFYLGPSKPADNDHLATSLDLRSGALLWQHEVGTYAALDYVDHRLWQWKDDRLAVLDPATGEATRTLRVRKYDTSSPGSQHVVAASADLIVLNASATIYAYRSSDGRQLWHYRADSIAGLLADNTLVLLKRDGPMAIDAVNGAGPCKFLYCPGQLL